jgi:nucleotide-binding universal stress UspA family protein
MLQVTKILVPTDFSPACDAALTHACHWARRLGAEVHIFHALQSLRPDVYPASLGASDPAWIPLTLRESAEAQLATRLRLAADQGVAATCATADGLSPAPTILDYAQSHDVGLVIMSTHGRRGVRRMLLGSVAEEVVQRAQQPVLTMIARSLSARPPEPRRILVALDLSEHSAVALACAKQLAAAFGAQLLMLHVLIQSPVPALYDDVAAAQLTFSSPRFETKARQALESMYRDAGGENGRADAHVERGPAVERILEFASTHSIDLVVLASHGLTGLAHVLMGSVAERVVRRASCPVLTVKSFGRSRPAADGSPPRAGITPGRR